MSSPSQSHARSGLGIRRDAPTWASWGIIVRMSVAGLALVDDVLESDHDMRSRRRLLVDGARGWHEGASDKDVREFRRVVTRPQSANAEIADASKQGVGREGSSFRRCLLK